MREPKGYLVPSSTQCNATLHISVSTDQNANLKSAKPTIYKV